MCCDRRGVVPVGALFAVVLALGNAAYLFLSVSFIQMLKVGYAYKGGVLLYQELDASLADAHCLSKNSIGV